MATCRLLAAFAVLLGMGAAPQTSPPLAITGVTLVDGTEGPARSATTLLIRDGRIEVIGPSSTTRVPDGATRLDGAGRFLIPALIDAHVHLATREEADAPAAVLLPSLVAHGVLAVRDMGGVFDRVVAMRASVAAGTIAGPAIITPGPFVDGPQVASAMVSPVAAPGDAASVVRALAARRVDFIKVQAGLSAESWRAVVAAARTANLTVAGHVPEAISAFDVATGGQRSVEHVSPALVGDAGLLLAASRDEAAIRAEMRDLARAMAQPEPLRGAVRARERALQRRLIETTDDARAAKLFAAMRQHGVVSVPTLVWSEGLLPQSRTDTPSADVLAFVPQAARARWVPQRTAQLAAISDEDLALNRAISAASLAFVGAMHRAGVTVVAGTDAMDSFLPLGGSLHAELERLAAAGLSPRQSLAAATRESARLLGMDDRGTIAVGKRADLVLLDSDPLADIRATRQIRAVVQAGRVYDRTELDRMLDAVRAAAR